MTCRGSYEIIFLSFLIVLCHLQAKTYFYFNMNLHHEDERNACSKNHINITVFYPLSNAKNRRSLCLLVLPVGILLMSPYFQGTSQNSLETLGILYDIPKSTQQSKTTGITTLWHNCLPVFFCH